MSQVFLFVLRNDQYWIYAFNFLGKHDLYIEKTNLESPLKAVEGRGLVH